MPPCNSRTARARLVRKISRAISSCNRKWTPISCSFYSSHFSEKPSASRAPTAAGCVSICSPQKIQTLTSIRTFAAAISKQPSSLLVTRSISTLSTACAGWKKFALSGLSITTKRNSGFWRSLTAQFNRTVSRILFAKSARRSLNTACSV